MVIGFRTGHPQSLSAGGGEDEELGLDGALSDSDDKETGRRWVA